MNLRRALGAMVAAATLAACGAGGGLGASDPATSDTATADAATSDTVTSDTPDTALSGELTVAAAASLSDAFTELGAVLEEVHPDLDVTFTFAASSTLASQIVAGAPVDVFASANPRQMAVVTDAGLTAEEPVTFATNELTLVVEAGNPHGVAGLQDLMRDDLIVVLPAPEVPAGELAARVLDAAGIAASPASLEVDVRATLGRVALGEADVALVYRSDVVSAGDAVEGVAIDDPSDGAGDDASDLATDYPIVALDGSTDPRAAVAWIELITGPRGREVLERAGLGAP